MMSSVTLTYARYQPNTGFRAPVRPMDQPSQESRSPGTTASAKATKVPQAVPSVNSFDEGRSGMASDEEMRELVERLNHRVNPAEKAIRFKVDETRRQTRIVMTSGADVLNNFSREDVPTLETYLHDMAGLQFSFVT